MKKVKVLVVVLAMVYMVAGTASADLNDGLVAYYPLDGNAYEMSENGPDGIEYGGVTYVDGKVCQAAKFDGIDDYIEVLDASNLNPPQLTISAWINPIDITQQDVFVHKHFIVLNKEHQYEIAVFGEPRGNVDIGELAFAFNPLWSWYGADYIVPLETFTHIAVTFDTNNTAKVYVNGAMEKVQIYSSGIQSRPSCLRIGARGCYYYHPFAHFNGIIDEVRIYNRVLTNAEIQELFQLTPICPYLDNQGPLISDLVADPTPVGSQGIVYATVDDAETGGSSIKNVGYSVDGGSPQQMTATDGDLDESNEEVFATLPAFVEAGVYKVCVQGTDFYDNSGPQECTFLAVYDPNSGFVTGGGWIDSPEGAYIADPTLTGKANFGFVSKYQQGANTPTGETQFHFKVADLNFHSDTYDWLVVAGPKAMYKGTGTINGSGNYGFMLTAIDEKLTPSTNVDLFRIKIWDKDAGDAIVYDNNMGDAEDDDPTTAIGGGSIVIHKDN